MMLDFLSVGFQYHRSPTPLKKNWAKDLKKLKADGFNTVKYWLQWRWSQPTPDGEYDFSDTDELMDLAQENGLKVVLNIILDVAPTWLYDKYPDAYMITNNGEVMYSRPTEYRQIGGTPGPCFHHDEVTKIRMDYVEACAKRYANHPALWVWDVWNEPELSVGLKREAKTEDLLCYCEHSQKAFRKWLLKKYGTIERLNEVWGRNYQSFDEAEACRRNGTFADMNDWRLFFNDTLTEDFRLRTEVIKKYDNVHAVMCHTVPPPLFNSISCCSDDFEMGKIGDLLGNSVGSSALASNILKSASNGKPIINSEIHAVYGNALNGFHCPTENDMRRNFFIPMTNGVKGFLFWQYRPEILGQEAPAWGNVSLKGETTPWHQITIDVNKYLQSRADKILAFTPKRGKVGVYMDKKCEIYCWNATHGNKLYDDSLQGAYSVFRQNNNSVEFFTDDYITEDGLKDFELICFPVAFVFDYKKTAVIKKFVENGGTVIFEAFAGMLDNETGMHDEDYYGCGITELSGVRADIIHSTAMIENAYDWELVMQADSDAIAMEYNGEAFTGVKYMLDCTVEKDVEVLAQFKNGAPAVYKRKVGKGNVITAGTLVFAGCHRYGGATLAKLIESVYQEDREAWIKDAPYGLRIDPLGDSGIVVIENTQKTALTFAVPKGYKDVFGVMRVQGDKAEMQSLDVAVLEKI